MRRRLRRSRKQQRGGGYGDNPAHSIIPGQVIHAKYDGVGTDCAGSPQRAGALDGIGMLRAPGGLPGLSNGFMSGGRRRRRGGGQLGSGGVVTNPYGEPVINSSTPPMQGGSYLGVAVQDGEMPSPASGFKPASALPVDPAGLTYSYARQAQAQTGGRYGADLAAAADIYGSNGVGYASLAPTGSVRCEAGSTNPLNADPALQMQTTNPNSSLVPGWAPRFNPLAGGSRKRRRHQRPHKRRRSQRQQKKKLNQRGMKQSGGGTDAQNLANASPYYFAGQIDSMKYNAPTAGYEWQPLNPAVQNNAGINDQKTYAASHYNQACVKTN